jgi:hypothetical protein
MMIGMDNIKWGMAIRIGIALSVFFLMMVGGMFLLAALMGV